MRHRTLSTIAGTVVAVSAIAILLRAAGETPEARAAVQGAAPARDPGTTPSPPTGTALVSGIVVSADGRNGVRRALVRLAASGGGATFSARTDDQGGFTFQHVPAGRFMLTASKPGYLDVSYGQRRVGSGRPGVPLTVTEGERIARISLTMPRASVITGTIVDDAGEPAFGTMVRALRFVRQEGERMAVTAGTALVDDRGIYRISALLPGEYAITAAPPSDGAIDGRGGLMMIDGVGMSAAGAMIGGATFGPIAVPSVRMSAGDVQDAPTSGYAPLYYPGTTSAAAAQTIELGIGEERVAIDLRLTLVALGRISGTVIGVDPSGPKNVVVQLADPAQTLPSLTIRSTATGADGTFLFSGVPPGEYTVSARTGGAVGMQLTYTTSPTGRVNIVGNPGSASGPAARPMWASADVVVSPETTTLVTLSLEHGMTVTGRVTFAGASPPPTDLAQLRIVLNAARADQAGMLGGRAVVGSVAADGQFRIVDIMPGQYVITVANTGPWRLRSFEVGGRDVLDGVLEIKPGEDMEGVMATLTDRVTSLSGQLQDPSGQPTSDYTIILVAQDRRYWIPRSRRIRAADASADGHFSFDGLPAGDYRLMAVTDVDDGQWFDPAYFDAMVGSSIAVTLGEGEKRVQDIRVSAPR